VGRGWQLGLPTKPSTGAGGKRSSGGNVVLSPSSYSSRARPLTPRKEDWEGDIPAGALWCLFSTVGPKI
jgi:hypothetical protein